MTRLETIKKIVTKIIGLDSSQIDEHSTPKTLGLDYEALVSLESEFANLANITELRGDTTIGDIMVLMDDWLGPELPENGLMTLTESQFIRRYEPEVNEHGDYYRQREWCIEEDVPTIERAVSENRCWTMVDDDDGDPCIVWGNRMVNRIYNIITKYPVENPDWEVQVPFDEEDSEEDGDE